MVVETNKDIAGIKVARRAPSISHLLFVDDILIFVKADIHNINSILSILHKFGSVFGQTVNFDKSCVYFSNNLSPGECEDLAQKLNMTLVDDSETYLGAPSSLVIQKLNLLIIYLSHLKLGSRNGLVSLLIK